MALPIPCSPSLGFSFSSGIGPARSFRISQNVFLTVLSSVISLQFPWSTCSSFNSLDATPSLHLLLGCELVSPHSILEHCHHGNYPFPPPFVISFTISSASAAVLKNYGRMAGVCYVAREEDEDYGEEKGEDMGRCTGLKKRICRLRD